MNSKCNAVKKNIRLKVILFEFLSIICNSFVPIVLIKQILKMIFDEHYIYEMSKLEVIIVAIILSIGIIIWRVYGPVLGYKSALKKIEIYEKLNDKETVIEVFKETLDKEKISNNRRAHLLYELSYKYFDEIGIEAVER